jgi:acetylglutamate kinase
VTSDPNAYRASEKVPPAPVVPVVIKIGGRSLEAPGAPRELAAEVASLSDEMLLVHGGGREVSDWCTRLAIKPSFIDGLRVTDAATLEVVVAVLSGLANKRLVALLREAGVDAVGLSGADGGIVEIEHHPDCDRLGFVGRIRAVHPELIQVLLAHGRTPVLSSVASLGGELYNLNADELAAALAGSLKASTLVLLSDAPGLRLGGAIVPELDDVELATVMDRPEVSAGMIPKLRAAHRAIEDGVERVRIAAWSGPGTLRSLIHGSGSGTTLTRNNGTEIAQ